MTIPASELRCETCPTFGQDWPRSLPFPGRHTQNLNARNEGPPVLRPDQFDSEGVPDHPKPDNHGGNDKGAFLNPDSPDAMEITDRTVHAGA